MVAAPWAGELDIAGRRVGYAHEPLVIAEIGINHGGSLEVAREMVAAAARAGAEVVKHQTHIPEAEMARAARSVVPGNADVSIFEIMERCALSEEEERELMRHAGSLGVTFLSTPFSREGADRLEGFGVAAYKIGSGEFSNLPLVEHVASFGKPMLLSTGMHALEELDATVDVLLRRGVPFALLHTTNLYPTPDHLVRLGALTELMERYPGLPVGLSDHTTSNLACLGGVALGASVLERHFTDRMDRPGPDVVCSMDPAALGELIHGARVLARQRGGRKDRRPEEQVTRDFAYASVVSLRAIAAGEVLDERNLWVKRPGTGEIPAARFAAVMGRRAAEDVAEGELLRWSQVEGGRPDA